MNLGVLTDDSCSYGEWQFSAVLHDYVSTSTHNRNLRSFSYVYVCSVCTTLRSLHQCQCCVRVICLTCMHLTPYIWFPIGV